MQRVICFRSANSQKQEFEQVKTLSIKCPTVYSHQQLTDSILSTLVKTQKLDFWLQKEARERNLWVRQLEIELSFMIRQKLALKTKSHAWGTLQGARVSGTSKQELQTLSNKLVKRSASIAHRQGFTSTKFTSVKVWKLTFLGLVTIRNPLRSDRKRSISRATRTSSTQSCSTRLNVVLRRKAFQASTIKAQHSQ